MDKFKVGDFVYFSTSNSDDVKLFTDSGMIININNKIISILCSRYGASVIYNLSKERVNPISNKEEIIKDINTYYDEKINNLQNQIKSMKRGDYEAEIVNKYNQLRQEIISTAKNMINTRDDEDFENKLKAICLKKKQLFEIECESLQDARKYNGNIKYQIKELEKTRNNALQSLDRSIDELKKKLSL